MIFDVIIGILRVAYGLSVIFLMPFICIAGVCLITISVMPLVAWLEKQTESW